jgi:hypothetical protein
MMSNWKRKVFKPLCVSPMAGENEKTATRVKTFYSPCNRGTMGVLNNDFSENKNG